MCIKILFEYLFGYLNIQLEGFFIERVINKAVLKKIFLWKLRRDKASIIYANIGINEFKEISKIAKENKCRIKIINKKGLPFLFNKYKKRKMFLIFFLMLMVILFTLSRFIWNIEIDGLNTINKEDIVKELDNDGLKLGKLKRKLDTNTIINNVRLNREDIAWIGIEIHGTNAIVKIVEADKKPVIVDDNDYCNIISDKDAQIVKISAQRGSSLVKEGDIVTKGEILIAGWMEGKYTGTRYVNAEGEIKAKVWYTKKEKIELMQTITEQTGKYENKYEIKFNNFLINFNKTLSKFEIYDTIYESKKIKIFSNFYLPIELIKKTNYEKHESQITYGTEEAKNMGIEKLSEEIENNITDKSNILQKYINAYASDGYVEVEVTYEVLEDIGTKEKIVF